MNILEEETINSLKKALQLAVWRELTKAEELLCRKCYEIWYRDAKKVFNDGKIDKIRV